MGLKYFLLRPLFDKTNNLIFFKKPKTLFWAALDLSGVYSPKYLFFQITELRQLGAPIVSTSCSIFKKTNERVLWEKSVGGEMDGEIRMQITLP